MKNLVYNSEEIKREISNVRYNIDQLEVVKRNKWDMFREHREEEVYKSMIILKKVINKVIDEYESTK